MAAMPDMSDPRTLAEAVAAAAGLTEAVFLGAGRALESPIESLNRMTATSERVLADLAGGPLGHSLAALSRAAAVIGRMGQSPPDEAARFLRLDALATELGARIGKLTRSLNALDPLAINARVVAAGIRASGVDFSTFADDIARTLRMTRASLQALQGELRSLGAQIASARAGQSALHERREAAAASVPARLKQTIEALARQNDRAAAASGGVRRSIDAIHGRLHDAVMALQIGDITRQRLEHVHHGLILLTQALAAPAMSQAPPDGAALTVLLCRLLAAQIADTAARFERDVALVATSVDGLRREAHGLHDLAVATSGGAERSGGTVIADLEAHTGAALSLFQDFGAARAAAMDIAAAVGAAADGLCGHLRDVQSLEADIRIMGLNTTFRCARIGVEGRPLSLIAQQLRTYADGFAKEAGALIREVELMAQLTRALNAGGEADAAGAIADVVEAMRGAMATLRTVGLSVDAAVRDLGGESDRVVAAIEETTRRLAENAAIATAMRQVQDALAALAPGGALLPAAMPPGAEDVLDRLAAAYTMDDERLVHDRVLGPAAPRPAPRAAPAAADIDDMLF
jgi:prefoldin subunit 5